MTLKEFVIQSRRIGFGLYDKRKLDRLLCTSALLQTWVIATKKLCNCSLLGRDFQFQLKSLKQLISVRGVYVWGFRALNTLLISDRPMPIKLHSVSLTIFLYLRSIVAKCKSGVASLLAGGYLEKGKGTTRSQSRNLDYISCWPLSLSLSLLPPVLLSALRLHVFFKGKGIFRSLGWLAHQLARSMQW